MVRAVASNHVVTRCSSESRLCPFLRAGLEIAVPRRTRTKPGLEDPAGRFERGVDSSVPVHGTDARFESARKKPWLFTTPRLFLALPQAYRGTQADAVSDRCKALFADQIRSPLRELAFVRVRELFAQ